MRTRTLESITSFESSLYRHPRVRPNTVGNRPLRLLITDFDHTLTVGKEADWFAFASSLRMIKCRIPPRSAFFRWRRLHDVHAIALNLCKGDEQLANRVIRARRRFLYTKMARSRIAMKPGVKGPLQEIRRRVKVMAIATTSNRGEVMRLLRKNNMAYLFDSVESREFRGRDPVRSQAKKLEMYGTLLRRFSVRAENTLVVGNSANDLIPGLNLGCSVVAMAGDYGVEKGLREMGAASVDSWKELLSVLDHEGFNLSSLRPREGV